MKTSYKVIAKLSMSKEPTLNNPDWYDIKNVQPGIPREKPQEEERDLPYPFEIPQREPERKPEREPVKEPEKEKEKVSQFNN